jgi:heme/copper-type cytochrome/quinol oxidase subunit 1
MRLSVFWTVVVAGLTTWFAVANRTPVWFSLDPLAAPGAGAGLNTPLFGLMLGAFGFGALAGGVAVFFSTLRVRARARDERKEAEGFARAVSTTTAVQTK